MGLFDAFKNSFSGPEMDDVWKIISAPRQVKAIIEASKERPQLIYKHSHRCSVCFVSKGTLEQAADEILNHADMHFVDVVQHREASNYIASSLNVRHQSPQAILVDQGEAVWKASHGSITAEALLGELSKR